MGVRGNFQVISIEGQGLMLSERFLSTGVKGPSNRLDCVKKGEYKSGFLLKSRVIDVSVV